MPNFGVPADSALERERKERSRRFNELVEPVTQMSYVSLDGDELTLDGHFTVAELKLIITAFEKAMGSP